MTQTRYKISTTEKIEEKQRKRITIQTNATLIIPASFAYSLTKEGTRARGSGTGGDNYEGSKGGQMPLNSS